MIPLVVFAFCVLLLSACTTDAPPAAEPATTPVVAPPAPAPVAAPLPPAQALIDVLARLSDPAVAGADKVGLVELATADDAAALDKFGKALADNGALPLSFEATDLKWSEADPGNVVAAVDVTTANDPPGKFSFPMEFTPVRDGWQLTRKTADLLLQFGDSATASTPPR
ncbi:hypothetical protein MAGR_64290 [Mycolicibacterium agri]|uniref:Low molecular weight antigen MTB12-like C-terminal domain-containing protein n=1 Tax=Mycolicibacterium agri TaxID=36811 RepID=A0A7I9WCF0_MYCAG|nr:hypothetical protein MAGR_64290 [Mycolicibacterium agri]